MGRSGARRGAPEVQPRAARRSSSRLLGQAARAPLRRRSRPRTRPPLHNPTDLRHPVSRCDIDSHRDCRPILILIVAPRRIAQNRGFHPRSRRRLPPVRVSSARSRLQPCRARSDARTSTAVRYPLRRHAGARPARIPRRVLHCLDSIYTRTLPDDNRRSLFISQ